ncbi:MotA/TolQ/ExbB proton channel family protein [Agaribacterium haliotis]|uniref:MotA/TolQ/ExbB proton channel family protein n=1 Tax=Agaribacterium haliotis TaxID=2013869 RepID=UPI000BB56427|nr:MotA/TolQ/ExbB proton channel family protein [Agaribacterium haliotis]
MRTVKSAIVGLVTAGLMSMSFGAFAQDDKAASLDELLKMVNQSKIGETKESRSREAQFKKQRAQQAKLLEQAKAEKAAQEKRSEQLEAQAKELEAEIKKARTLREERLGALNELFGHMTSTAGDLRSNIESSLVSAQFPGREEFLSELIDKMNSETKLPTTAELEKLWSLLLQEVIESGKVTSFSASVSDPSGNQNQRTVVRIGNYNLVSDGKYLEFNPKSGNLSELARQPANNNSLALQNATSGFTKVGVDPTGPAGGQLLKALIDTPNLKERWQQGGFVGTYFITPIFVIGLLIAFIRFIALGGIGAKVSKQLKSKKANPNNPLGRVLKVAEDNPGIDTESLELKLEEAVLKERPAIESLLPTLKIISMVAPLLGLLGTVTGMIVVFQAITIYGAGDPKAMAGGISSALVTTVMGLIVAIPTVLLHTFLSGKAKRITHILEEQSAGIIARKAEG